MRFARASVGEVENKDVDIDHLVADDGWGVGAISCLGSRRQFLRPSSNQEEVTAGKRLKNRF